MKERELARARDLDRRERAGAQQLLVNSERDVQREMAGAERWLVWKESWGARELTCDRIGARELVRIAGSLAAAAAWHQAQSCIAAALAEELVHKLQHESIRREQHR